VPAGVPVRVHTAAGNVDASRLDVPRLEVGTEAGAVTAAFVRAPQNVMIRTAAGNVELRLPDLGYRIDAETAVGPRQVDVVEDPAAPRSVSIETAAGSVTVLPS
jgi:DUF4097 and DUF4098 domain-containing protein YvlB